MKKIFLFVICLSFLFPFICFSSDRGLVISEVKIGGVTSTDEYIKIYNLSDSDINLCGYKIIKKTTSGSQYNLVSNFNEDSIIKAKSYFVVANKNYTGYGVDLYYTNNSYSLSKDNSVYIIDSNSNIVDLIGFGECFESEGNTCLENIDNNEIYVRDNNIDTDNNIHDFKILNLIDELDDKPVIIDQAYNSNSVDNTVIYYSKDIILSEIYPNPSEDEDEFIEINNIGNNAIDLTNYKIKDNSKKVFNIKNITLKAGEFYVFYKKDTGISLNNTGDEHIYLLTPSDEIIQDLLYSDAKRGSVYCYNNGSYFWSIIKTPGSENVIETENIPPTINCNIPSKVFSNIAFYIDCRDSYDENNDNIVFNFDMGDGRSGNNKDFYFRYFNIGNYVVNVTLTDSRGLKSQKEYKINVSDKIDDVWFLPEDIINRDCIEIDNGELQDVDVGKCIKMKSYVISLPNSIIDKCFYVSGAQIYSYSKNFPDIGIGDEVNIVGEVSSNRGEKRIKIKEKDNIKIISKQSIKKEYYEIYNSEDLDLNIANLVSITGEITSKTKNHIIIKNDNEQEFDVYISNKLYGSLDNINRGDNVSVIGIVNKINDKFRILLRDFNDVKKNINKNDFNIAMIQDKVESSYGYSDLISGNVSLNNDEYVIDTNNKKYTILLIILSTFVLFVIILLVLLFNKSRNNGKP